MSTTMVIGGVPYKGDQVRYPVNESCVKGFEMGCTSMDTNGRNINLLSGVVRDLIREVNRLDRQVKSLKGE